MAVVWSDLLSDPVWRLTHLYPVLPEQGPERLFTFRQAQEWLYYRIWWRNEILKARQLGFSTFILLWCLDRMLFNADQVGGLIDLTEDDAKKKLRKMQYAYDNVGKHLPGAGEAERLAVQRFIHNYNPQTTRNAFELGFARGSSISAGVSHRGGSLQFGHISELGRIGHSFPTRAIEIKTGMFPACHGPLFSESTHMGGKFGVNYELIKMAMENESLKPEEWTRLHWKFHFFPWWKHPEYRIQQNVTLSNVAVRHFEILEKNYGIKLEEPQKRWWTLTQRELGLKMGQEHPSVPNDAIESPVEGSIYGSIIGDIRLKGRVGIDFEIDRRFPCFVSWDIGRSDFTDLWLVQFAGPNVHWLSWYHANNESPSHYAEIIRQWNREFPIAAHLLPHDAKRKDYVGLDYVHHLTQCGIGPIEVVPVVPDKWVGIDALKEILRRSIFHKRTTQEMVFNGEELPGGVTRLESYRKKVVQMGEIVTEEPVHDEYSHTADAARTAAEAYEAGIVQRYAGPGGTKIKRTTPTQAYLP